MKGIFLESPYGSVYIRIKFGDYRASLVNRGQIDFLNLRSLKKSTTVAGLSDLLTWLTNDDVANDANVVNDVNLNVN